MIHIALRQLLHDYLINHQKISWLFGSKLYDKRSILTVCVKSDLLLMINTCAVGPIGTPGTHTGPEGRIPKTLRQITWYITSKYVARECN